MGGCDDPKMPRLYSFSDQTTIEGIQELWFGKDMLGYIHTIDILHIRMSGYQHSDILIS